MINTIIPSAFRRYAGRSLSIVKRPDSSTTPPFTRMCLYTCAYVKYSQGTGTLVPNGGNERGETVIVTRGRLLRDAVNVVRKTSGRARGDARAHVRDTCWIRADLANGFPAAVIV